MNMGMLLMVCSAIAALCVAGTLASNPVGIAAVALAGVVAAVYSVVTGFSIRDLVRSCKQVKQVKEEGLVTVQSLQPVLTPVTPNPKMSEVGKRVGYGITAAGTAAAAGAGGYFATQAAVGYGITAAGTAAATGAGGNGLVASIWRFLEEVVGTLLGVSGTGAAATAGTVAACACAFLPYALMAFSILVSVCSVIQSIADLYSAKVPVTSKCFSSVIDNYKDTKDYKGGPDLLNHDEIEDYKQEKKAGMRMLKWLTPPLAASPTCRILTAAAGVVMVIAAAFLCSPLPCTCTIAIVAPLVSCLFYGYAAYACKRRGRKSVIPDTSPCIETTAEPLEQSPPSTPEQEVCADPTVTALVHNTQDWEPVPTCSSVEVVSGDLHSKGVGTTEEQGLKQNTDQGWEPVAKTDGSCTAKTAPEKVAKAAKTTEKVAKATFGGTGGKVASTTGTAAKAAPEQNPSSKCGKSTLNSSLHALASQSDFLAAASDLYSAVTSDGGWEPVPAAPTLSAKTARAR
ncbi:hypothetical protein [Anaplasma centrale]